MDEIKHVFVVGDAFLGLVGSIFALWASASGQKKVSVMKIIMVVFSGYIGARYVAPAVCGYWTIVNCDLAKIMCSAISLPLFSAIIKIGSTETFTSIGDKLLSGWKKEKKNDDVADK